MIFAVEGNLLYSMIRVVKIKQDDKNYVSQQVLVVRHIIYPLLRVSLLKYLTLID